MNLDFTEEQETLREMVRRVCNEQVPLDIVRALENDPTGYPAEFWKQLAELGLLGILIPEEYGGADLSMLDAAIVYEEFGRSLAPSPHFVSAVLGGGALVVLLENLLSAVSVPSLLKLPLLGLVFGTSFLMSRAVFRRFMKRRVRILTGLLDRLSHHITDTAIPPLLEGTPPEDKYLRSPTNS